MKKLLCIIFVIICMPLRAQTKDSILPTGVRVIARAQQGKILLRWAINHPVAWQKNTHYGYRIERYTIIRNGDNITPEKVVLSSQLTPKPLKDWQSIVQENDHAAILAQAIYGESFEVGGNQNDLMNIVNKAEELDQRFSFALFAADMNFKAAKMAGLGFEDNTVQKNERYLYKIIPLIPKEKETIVEGAIYIKASDISPLPPPIDLISVFSDKEVMLTWEYSLFKKIYTSYYVEKSENGQSFYRITNTPLVNLNDKENTPAKRMYYIDTLAQNNKTYYYRVVGISPFGELGAPSEVTSGKGLISLKATPRISGFEIINPNKAMLSWEFPKEAENQIVGFELNHATTANGPFKTVQTSIAPTERKTLFYALESSNYFTISALGKNQTKQTSLVKLVQPIDSIPPNAPVGLTGKIDSLGVVTLQWKPNSEKDLQGYRIFRGNTSNEDFSQLTKTPVPQTHFTDSVQLASLNSKVYYSLVAVDHRFNMSDYSEVLTLEKPDIVPPSSPIFKDFKHSNGQVWIQWINSPDDDVVKHTLFRQHLSGQSDKWWPVFETDTITSFTDKKVLEDHKYRYAIFAEDDNSLISSASAPITITVTDHSLKEVIKGLDVYLDRQNNFLELFWNKPKDKNIIEILVYKEKKEANPMLIKQVPKSINRITDTHISPNNNYTYHVKAVFKNGSYSKMKSISINY